MKNMVSFQFLIGSMKGCLKKINIAGLRVSIPYRFNERSQNIREDSRIPKFQFLIGSMKVKSFPVNRARTWFQFLIGSMKEIKMILIL